MPRTLSRLVPSALALAWLSLAAVGSGCAATVSRTGYEPPPAAPAATTPAPSALTAEAAGGPAATCPVLITADTTAIAVGAPELLGAIRYRDSGFSTRCDEAAALRLFRADACHLGADVVLLTSERSPDLWSTCYRAEAQFYRVGEPAALAEIADRRDPGRLRLNRGADSERQLWSIVGYTAGTVAGTLLVSLLLGGE